MNKQVWAMPVWIGDQWYWRPTTQGSVDYINNSAKDMPTRMNPVQPRRGKHHNLYWAILGVVAKNCDQYRDDKALHEAILFQMGRVEKRIVVQPNGEWHVTYDRHSISYAEKDQAEFQGFYDEAMVMIESMGFCIADIMAEITKEFGK